MTCFWTKYQKKQGQPKKKNVKKLKNKDEDKSQVTEANLKGFLMSRSVTIWNN